MKPILTRGAFAVTLFVILFLQGAALADDNLSDEGIERLLRCHDPEVMVAVGRVYVKQTGLRAIRAMLAEERNALNLGAEWNDSAPEWQAAETELVKILDSVVAREIEDPRWLFDGWRPIFAKALTPQEASYVADHLSTEIGREQRNVYEVMLIGETLLATYTYAGRIKYDVKGSERETRKMQDVWHVRKPVQLRNFEEYPEAIQFGASRAGITYVKVLQIAGISVITARFDAVGQEAERAVRAAKASFATPHVEAYRARRSAAQR